MAQAQELVKKIYERLITELPEWDIGIHGNTVIARFYSEKPKYNVDIQIKPTDNGVVIEYFAPYQNGNYMIVRNSKAIPAAKTEIRINHEGDTGRLIEITLTIVLALAYNT